MIKQFQQLAGIGRLDGLTHPNGNEHELKELALIYGRNSTGKTTLARVIATAAAANSDDLRALKTLGSDAPPAVTLRLSTGVCRFNGREWMSSKPNAIVFDRDFIEANVYVGRSPTKQTRRELLRVALGATSVAHARLVDEISMRSRDVAGQLRQVEAVLSTAALDHGVPVDEFEALAQVDDCALRAAEERLTWAQTAEEIMRRPTPSALPLPPALNFDQLKLLLATDSQRLSEEASQAVRRHLEAHTRPGAEEWVRTGLNLRTGDSCPFCGQSVDGLDLIEQYRLHFDDKYDRFVSELTKKLHEVTELDQWWIRASNAGQRNVEAFKKWADVLRDEVPMLGSRDRANEKNGLQKLLAELLAQKRANPNKAVPGVSRLDWAAKTWKQLVDAFVLYNDGVAKARARIEERRTELQNLSVASAQRALRLMEASQRRWQKDLADAIASKVALKAQRQKLENEKSLADEKFKAEGPKQLRSFATRLTAILAELSADFQVEGLENERTGGTNSAKLTLRFPKGTFTIDSRSDERQVIQLLSDGDRSTLALALFLVSVESEPDLQNRVLVFDDPMTSLDADRSEATAEIICRLAGKAAQVIVLSHHGPFLAQLARAWRRHLQPNGRQLSELQLERNPPELRKWDSETEVEAEYLRRWRRMADYVAGKLPDKEYENVRGDIRKILEPVARILWPDLFPDSKATLEKAIRTIRADPALQNELCLTDSSLDELDRLCAFGAAGNHDQSHSDIPASSPESVRTYARRALHWIRTREARFKLGPQAVA